MAMYYNLPGTYLPSGGHWETTADWPKSYYYIPNQSPAQGIHPPGPIYSAAPAPTPGQSGMYYYPVSRLPAPRSISSQQLTLLSQGGQGIAAGYYANGMYYGGQAPAAPAPGWPCASSYTCYPMPSATTATSPLNAWAYYSPYCAVAGAAANPLTPGALWNPTTATAQVAAAIAANSALAQQPNAPSYFVGGTPTEIATQAAIIQANLAALSASQQPTTHAPFKPGNGSQVWVKETDGSWTLKDLTDAIEFGPGHWEQHGVSKYWYFIKHAM